MPLGQGFTKSDFLSDFRFPLGKIYEDVALMPFITSLCSTVTYIQKHYIDIL